MRQPLIYLLLLGLLFTTKFSYGQESGDEKKVVKISDDLFIVSHTEGKHKYERVGITNADKEYIIEPEHYNIRHMGGRNFILSKGPKYHPLYQNSLRYSRSFITIDENQNIRSQTRYITPQNLSKVNTILQSYFGAQRDYTLDELTYALEVSYGIQHLNKRELNKTYTISDIRLMGHLHVKTADKNSFKIPLYFSLNSSTDQADTKFILGTPLDKPLVLFDQDFNTIAENVQNVMVGFKKEVPIFLGYTVKDQPKFEVLDFDSSNKQSLLTPYFGFHDIMHSHIYVDDRSFGVLKNNKSSKIYLDENSDGGKFYRKDQNQKSFQGNFSIEKAQTVINTDTYEMTTFRGYKNKVILSRDGLVSMPLNTDTKIDFYSFIPTEKGILYPATVNGNKVILDQNFQNYLASEGDQNIKILDNAMAILDGSNTIIGLMDFDNNTLVESSPDNRIEDISSHVLFQTKELDDENGKTTEGFKNQLLIFQNEKWTKSPIQSISKTTGIERNRDILIFGYDEKIGMISHLGKEIFPPTYESITGSGAHVYLLTQTDYAGNKLTSVYDGKNYKKLFTTDYKIRSHHSGNYIFNKYGSKQSGLMDNKGNILFAPDKTFLDPLAGVELIYFTDSPSLTSGLLDLNGNVIFETEYGRSPQVREYKNQKIILFQTNHNSVQLVNIMGKVIDTIENARFSWNNSVKGDYLELFDLNKKYIRYNFKTKKVTTGRA